MSYAVHGYAEDWVKWAQFNFVCSEVGLEYDPRTGICGISTGKLGPPVRVPYRYTAYVWWQALLCKMDKGYLRSTGLLDELRKGDKLGCCRDNADFFCQDWVWLNK